MKKKKEDKSDLEECRRKILNMLDEYNCVIETDDYHWSWIRDKDTDETMDISR